MADLSTTYLGLQLKNPLVVSASTLSASVENIKKMETAGAAAVVLPSLFEEQIELKNLGFNRQNPPNRNTLPVELQHIPNMREYNQGASGYLAHIYQAKRAVKIPIIGSINGFYGGGWVKYARLIEAAGADALELNIYYLAGKLQVTGDDVEKMYLDLVRDVKANVSIPVAVKISPYFSALGNVAAQLDQHGIDGLVLFNRFYQPDFDIEQRMIVPSLELSSPVELRLRLRWVAMLYNHVKADFGVTGGVHSGVDLLKSIMAGAKVAMVASVLFARGIDTIQEIITEVNTWLDDHDHDSIQELVGCMSQSALDDSAALERANYMNVLSSL